VKDSPSGTLGLGFCDVCGSYLSRLDNDQRLADRFYGKMHLGYAQMRKTYEAYPKELRGRSRPMQDGDSSPGPWGVTREAMEMKGMGVEGAVTVGGVGKRWWIRRERERI
jgi:LUC7 N_terminus